MADRTLEELIVSLNNLYVNLNNLDRVYYDIFINPTPMDVTLYRYLDPSINELSTITVPNRAKCAIMTATGILNPNGNQSGEVGSLYINTLTYDLYYKGSGSGKIGWYRVLTDTNFRPNEHYVTPDGNVATATYATTAGKLGYTTVGSTSVPIYLNGGEATACGSVANADISNLTSTGKSNASLYAFQNMGLVFTSGTSMTLVDNRPHYFHATGNATLILPNVTDDSKLHQMLVLLHVDGNYSVNVGTTHYFYGVAPTIGSGIYTLIYERHYDAWVVGCMVKS